MYVLHSPTSLLWWLLQALTIKSSEFDGLHMIIFSLPSLYCKNLMAIYQCLVVYIHIYIQLEFKGKHVGHLSLASQNSIQ